MSLLNREDFKKVLPILGMLNHCPPLLCVMMGKANKEEAMQELHLAPQQWGGGRGREDAAMRI
jgi:hypothetical protein